MEKKSIKVLFPNLEDALYDELLLHGNIKEIKAGDTILRVGQQIRSTILLIEGSIKLYREDNEGNEFFIYALSAGQACSLSMVCAAQQPSSEVLAKAMTNVIVLTVPLEYMDKWMQQYKSWSQFVIASYRARFEELLQTVDAIAFSNMDERLEFYLKRQAIHFGSTIKLTHQEIASDLNSSREVISRLLKKMETKGFLRLQRNSIEWLEK
ncbi:MAG: Crp/Fnr family transcriptional regulator [Bacteroidetes bacterium]|nr:Crp/Fnr family transcriptional regulator [Bacteroidota bacterium]